MLKQFSILTIIASAGLCSCETMRLSDVAPETEGSALGTVRLGKENKDFFVIPGAPLTPAQMRGEFPVPPQNIVVFKTRERQPLYRVAHLAGAPARGLSRACSFVVDTIVSLTFGWFRKKEPAGAKEVPVVFPATMRPADSFAMERPRHAAVGLGPAAGRPDPHLPRNGG